MCAPPILSGTVGPRSGGQAGTALATAGADDCPAGASAHAQPEAVFPRATAIVRLEGALHVRAPESTGCESVGCRRLPGHVRTRAHNWSPHRPIHGTWTRGAGSNQVAQTALEPGRPPPNPLLSHPAADRQPATRRATEETCGHWLMRSPGVVSVAGSTRLRRRAQSSGKQRISAGQRSAVMADGGRPDAPHTVDDGVDVVRGSQRPALVGHHRHRWKHKRETV